MRAAIVAASVLLFGAATHLGADWRTRSQNDAYLDDINESALRYVELTIASADALLVDLGREVATDCGSANLQGLRLRVYEHGGIKDVRVATHEGAVHCSAYAETLEFDRDWPARADMLPAGHEELRLFRVQQFTSDALGVFRDVDRAHALVAIVGVDPMQLDVLPNALRGRSHVTLELANGDLIATNAPAAGVAERDRKTVVRASTKYPVRTRIAVDTEVLGTWNAPSPVPLLAGAGLLGALFGVLAARSVGRPVSAAQTLDNAVARREFRPYYQPIFSLADRRIHGCEILMRWVQPDGRVLPPSAFIPLAESTGRIDVMTWQVLRIALAELRDVLRADPSFKVTFNAVPRHFLSEDFLPTLHRLAEEADASPHQIVVELTERDELQDHERAHEAIAALRRAGFRLALDDVGVGHSGLSHIQSLRPDILKIDKFFIDSLDLDNGANVVVDMLVRLAGELGMNVVAEGVETEPQLGVLRECGVREGQGYFVSPPVPLPTFLSLVEAAAREHRLAA